MGTNCSNPIRGRHAAWFSPKQRLELIKNLMFKGFFLEVIVKAHLEGEANQICNISKKVVSRLVCVFFLSSKTWLWCVGDLVAGSWNWCNSDLGFCPTLCPRQSFTCAQGACPSLRTRGFPHMRNISSSFQSSRSCALGIVAQGDKFFKGIPPCERSYLPSMSPDPADSCSCDGEIPSSSLC